MNKSPRVQISRVPRAVRIAIGIGLCLCLSACGVPIDSAAHAIKFGQPLIPASPNGSGGTPTRVTLYFVQRDRLVAVQTAGEAFASVDTTANELLIALDNGPTTREGSNLVTLLNSNPGLTCTFNPQTHIITVALDLQFVNTLYGPSLYEAYGQIVMTLMQTPLMSSVQGVNFQTDGTPTFAYLPTETVTQSPVTAASYASLVSPLAK